jgi:hypothetical protein
MVAFIRFIAVLVIALAAAPAAHATTMTLQKVTVDTHNQINVGTRDQPAPATTDPNDPKMGSWTAAEWKAAYHGKITWTTPDFKGTYDFPVPDAIPADGTPFKMTLTAEATNGSFAPGMSVSGDIVLPNKRVDLAANANANDHPTDTQTVTATLKPACCDPKVKMFIQDGPVYMFVYGYDPEPTPTPTPTPTPSPGPGTTPVAPLTATVSAIEGEVAVRTNAGEWKAIKVGDKVGEDSELFTGVDSKVVVTFSDGSRFEIRQLTQLLVDTILRKENRKDVAVHLVVGEVKATVVKDKVIDTNFEVQTPTATASVRGTQFRVFYDPASRATIVTTFEGTVEVKPVAAGLKTVLVGPGQEVEVTPKSITPIAGIGKAGARGGANRSRALALVAAKLAKSAKSCKLKIPKSPTAFGLKTAPAGWLVSVKVSGKARGKSTWTVKRGKASPKNAVAKRIARRCRR